jgi:predicted RNA-binding Zn-ribbon protein involved in translation (DUF1610 family)
VTDVERFFRRLVGNLAATDPARLHRPVSLDDISRSILPYRANRRALGLDTSEDYELVLLRLCAGEGGLVRTEPEEVRARFAQEIRSPNPDLHVLWSFENVHVTLRAEPLARALDASSDQAYAPPPTDVVPDLEEELARLHDLREFAEAELPGVEALRAPSPATEPVAGEPDEAAELELPETETRPSCPYCGGSLPVDRAVNFCPHCGQSQTKLLCHECRSEVEPGWRHCVTCGAAQGDG